MRSLSWQMGRGLCFFLSNCKAGPPLALRLFFCARGTLAPQRRCISGDALRLDRQVPVQSRPSPRK